MELLKFVGEHLETIIFVGALLFNAGIMYKVLRDKPSEKRVDEMIEKKFANHCPFINRIENLEDDKKVGSDFREKLNKTLALENQTTHLSLQRIEINVVRICDKLNIEYLESKM